MGGVEGRFRCLTLVLAACLDHDSPFCMTNKRNQDEMKFTVRDNAGRQLNQKSTSALPLGSSSI